MKRADLILSDSGGVQEEAPSVGTPVLVLREVTERPEAVDSGWAELMGMDRDLILRRASRGGSWHHHIKVSRCAARSSIPPEFKYADYGFRVARDLA